MNHERITLNDTAITAVMKLAEGNPGALNVCIQILKEGEKIDPDNVIGGMGILLNLDSRGIYASRIWCFYKDVCHQNLVSMVAVLRAVQLGLIQPSTLDHAIDSMGDGLDVADCLAKVKERLPRFGITQEPVTA